MADFLIHKAVHLEDALAKKTPQTHGRFFITEKFNGWWVRLQHNGEDWLPVQTAAYREAPALAYQSNLMNKCKWQLPKWPFYLIAEAIIPGMAFETANGKFNKKTESAERYAPAFMVHDLIVPRATFTAAERLQLLTDFFRHNYKNFVPSLGMYKADLLLPEPVPYDEVKWRTLFDTIVTRGGEGIVAKRSTSLYLEGKRTSDLLKLKMECQKDCKIVRFEQTVGKKDNPGFIMHVERANGIIIPVAVGKHTDRAKFIATPEAYIGKIAVINAMSEYKETGTLQQPVYSGIIREDKITPD